VRDGQGPSAESGQPLPEKEHPKAREYQRAERGDNRDSSLNPPAGGHERGRKGENPGEHPTEQAGDQRDSPRLDHECPGESVSKDGEPGQHVELPGVKQTDADREPEQNLVRVREREDKRLREPPAVAGFLSGERRAGAPRGVDSKVQHQHTPSSDHRPAQTRIALDDSDDAGQRQPQKHQIGAHRAESCPESGRPATDDTLLGDDCVHRSGWRCQGEPEHHACGQRHDDVGNHVFQLQSVQITVAVRCPAGAPARWRRALGRGRQQFTTGLSRDAQRPAMPTPADVPRAGEMPMLGLGTWQNDDHDQCAASVRTALEMGYRHIDTAQAYRNERAVGEGLAAADVDREAVFLATKVWISNLGGEDVVRSTEQSLDRLGTDYVDLLYVHWPAGAYDPAETLPALDRLVDRGLVRRVGVSNFEPAHIDRARAVLDTPVFANQAEVHPFLPQRDLQAATERQGLELVAYSPLARGKLLSNPTLGDIAEKHGASEPQIALAWLRERGVTAIPKATSEAHIRDNWESLALSLDRHDIQRIDAIDRQTRAVHPEFAPEAWG